MPQVEQISALEPEMQKLTDEQLRAKTQEFKAAVHKYLVRELGEEVASTLTSRKLSKNAPADGEASEDQPAALSNNSEKYKQVLQDALDSVLPQAFAAVREAGRRALDMRHLDVQLIGG